MSLGWCVCVGGGAVLPCAVCILYLPSRYLLSSTNLASNRGQGKHSFYCFALLQWLCASPARAVAVCCTPGGPKLGSPLYLRPARRASARWRRQQALVCGVVCAGLDPKPCHHRGACMHPLRGTAGDSAVVCLPVCGMAPSQLPSTPSRLPLLRLCGLSSSVCLTGRWGVLELGGCSGAWQLVIVVCGKPPKPVRVQVVCWAPSLSPPPLRRSAAWFLSCGLHGRSAGMQDPLPLGICMHACMHARAHTRAHTHTHTHTHTHPPCWGQSSP